MGVVSNLVTPPLGPLAIGPMLMFWFAYGPGVGGCVLPPFGYIGSIMLSGGGLRKKLARCLRSFPIMPSLVNGLAKTSRIPVDD